MNPLKLFSVILDFVKACPRWLLAAYRNFRDDLKQGSVAFKLVFFGLAVYFLSCIILGFYWSREPDEIAITDSSTTFEALATGIDHQITGSLTTASLIIVVDTLLTKPGGYISNDIAPPGVIMDNIPNWEYGVVKQVRDLSKALREVFSRSQSQSTEDKDLAIAEPRFNFSSDSWVFPSTESIYKEGIEKLNNYHKRLVDPAQSKAQFYARADNLEFWLESVEKRLGSLSQRLSASVGQRRLNTDLAGESQATQSTPTPREVVVKTPWYEVDDVFYEARGTTWALMHFLKAVEVDFSEVLSKKNAQVSLQQIIRELESTQVPLSSPMVLNGDGFGMFANHSLVMASYISRAHSAIIELRELLTDG